MDEMSSLYSQMNDMKLHKEIMQESDNLELEIQQTIDSGQKMLVASPQVLEKDNPVDTEQGGNDLSNNNLQTEVQTPSYQAPIPPGKRLRPFLIRALVSRPPFHLVPRLRPNLVPRACDPWEGNEGSAIIHVRSEYDWLLAYNGMLQFCKN
jgi:hypothetical protein